MCFVAAVESAPVRGQKSGGGGRWERRKGS